MPRFGKERWLVLGLLVACGDGSGDKNGQRTDSDAVATETADTTITTDTTTTTELVDDTAVTTEPEVTTDLDTHDDGDATEPDGAETRVDTDPTDTAPDLAEVDPPETEDIAPDLDDDVPSQEVDDDVPSDAPDTADDAAEVAEEIEEVEEVDVGPIDPCSVEPTIPLKVDTLTGFTGSEDFAFYQEYAYSVNENGNLVRDRVDGSGSLVLPNLSGFAAGMATLPDGRLAVNDAESGSLVIVTIAPPPGQAISKEVKLGGLAYPNGIDVDADGLVYIAEQDAGRVRQVDPNTGEFTIIASDLYNPNGVSFGPAYRRLYVGSFGGGIVYSIDRRDDGTWSDPSIYLALPGFGRPPETIDSCQGSSPGDWCYTSMGLGGQCGDTFENGHLQCEADPEGKDPLVEICKPLDENQSCSIKVGGQVYSGKCLDSGFSGLICQITQSINQPCFHANPGKACVSFQFGAPLFGVCTPGEDIPPEWGYPDEGLFCIQPGSGEGGGLDGLNVDACGTVYVTEYILGRVWRKTPGRPPEIAASLPSQWIPNMHWGNGIGGWDAQTLYVADRDQGRMFAIRVGREGKHTVAPP